MQTLRFTATHKQSFARGLKLMALITPFSALAAGLLWYSFTHHSAALFGFLYEVMPTKYATTVNMALHSILGSIAGLWVGLLFGYLIDWCVRRKQLSKPPVDVELTITDDGVCCQSCGCEFYYKWDALKSVSKLYNDSLVMYWVIPSQVVCLVIPSTAFETQSMDEFCRYAKERQKVQRPE